MIGMPKMPQRYGALVQTQKDPIFLSITPKMCKIYMKSKIKLLELLIGPLRRGL
jgi:hypothetical protein